jgi:hypothetical protein
MIPDSESLLDIILERRTVYGLDTDSRIRAAANRLTAKAFHELFQRLDDESEQFTEGIETVLSDFPVYGPDILIGFDDGSTPALAPSLDLDEGPGEFAALNAPLVIPYNPKEYWLRLVFTDQHAAYYQFPLFPDLYAEGVLSASRKRFEDSQLLRIEFEQAGALQAFTERCRANPHLLRIEECTPEEFHAAPSEAPAG